MNKILFALAVFAVVVSVTTGNKEQWKAKMKALVEECKASTNYNGDVMGEGDSSKEYKCFKNCMGEKMTFMKDGKLQGDKMRAMAEKRFGQGDKLETAKKAITKCESEVQETDKCEAAYKYMQCLKKEAPEFMSFGRGKKSGQ